jgi:hypothetical protein
MKTMCERDPQRWQDPDPNDLDAREACTFCWRRKQCAADAVRLDVVLGIWAGIVVPPRQAGSNWRKQLERRELVMAELTKIADRNGGDKNDTNARCITGHEPAAVAVGPQAY